MWRPWATAQFAVPLKSSPAAGVVNIVERQRLSSHQYADDIQVYSRCQPNDSTSLCRDLGGCIEHVASWMGTSRLQLNTPQRRNSYGSFYHVGATSFRQINLQLAPFR